MRNDLIKQRLVEELNSCRLTTTEIAKRVGVSPEMITQYRTTKKLPKLDTFAKLCKELDLDAAQASGHKKNPFFATYRTVPDCSAKDGFFFFRLFSPPVATLAAARCYKKLTNLSAVRRRAGEYADGAPSVPRRRPD